MGGHHAACGTAGWVALTATAVGFPALHVLPLTPGQTVLGGLLAAGAALLPDADHPQATAAHSAGVVSKAATSIVGAVSGGHRHGTHAPLVALAVCVLSWLAWQNGWIDTTRFTVSWWVCAAVITVLSAFALKVLKILRSWMLAWVAGALIGAGVCLLWPAFLPLLPAVVSVGIVIHLLGDILTTGGLPMFWPFKIPGPAIFPDAIWGKNGYVALPVLGNAGSWREWLLLVPISAYAIWGMGTSVMSMLPAA